MDFRAGKGKVYKPWKAPKFRKRVQTFQLCKIFKPNNIFRMCKRLFSSLFRPSAVPPQPLGQQQDPAFIACVIKVDASKPGWHKAISKVVANCEGDTRFKMDENGVVEVSGIGDPHQLLKKLGKSRRAKLRQLQYGQCSKNLFIPETKTKSSSQSQPQTNYHNPPGPYNRPFPPNQLGYGYPYYRQQPACLEHSYNQYPSDQGYGYPNYYQPPSHLEYGILLPYGHC